MIAERLRVVGRVQGVGFRPFVWRLAHEIGVCGWVRNDAAGVEIHAEGSEQALQLMEQRLRSESPAIAQVEALVVSPAAQEGAEGFVISESRLAGDTEVAPAKIAHDTAPCAQCVAEMLDPCNRRYRHAFITCTACGPRYTLSHGAPYDRSRTSLAPFPLCPACAREYADPGDRRFHAETLCCPACGPKLALLDMRGGLIGGDPIAECLRLIRRGAIVAIKGLGGFNLVCDARKASAVTALRARKRRDEKPFALLLANVASAQTFVSVGDAEAQALASAERPIVLLDELPPGAALPGIAPALGRFGVMLPATPIQLLLFHEAAGRPPGTGWLELPQALALVCTSANPGDEPLVVGNAEALGRLAAIADAVLVHDRDIVVRCDDSVLAARDGQSAFVRRARGYAPGGMRLARGGPAVLALGADLKNTVCVTRGDEAFISQHVGDLDTALGRQSLEETVGHLLAILGVAPEIVAHDLHPDFYSTRFAERFASARGLPLVAVQHHHAHLAAVLAEHGVDTPVLGLALDGHGHGADGGAWGGELLLISGAVSSRRGHLRPLALPGGDRAAREPWRMAAAVLAALARGDEIAERFHYCPGAPQIAELLERDLRTPCTSSLGRYFDAAAGLLGVCSHSAYEGQAALRLEALAKTHGATAALAQGWRIGNDGVLDLMPLLTMIADCKDAARGAAIFHATLIEALADWLETLSPLDSPGVFAGGGGCFLNAMLSAGLAARLAANGSRLLLAQALPPNDGGISLGQAWVARRAREA